MREGGTSESGFLGSPASGVVPFTPDVRSTGDKLDSSRVDAGLAIGLRCLPTELPEICVGEGALALDAVHYAGKVETKRFHSACRIVTSELQTIESSLGPQVQLRVAMYRDSTRWYRDDIEHDEHGPDDLCFQHPDGLGSWIVRRSLEFSGTLVIERAQLRDPVGRLIPDPAFGPHSGHSVIHELCRQTGAIDHIELTVPPGAPIPVMARRAMGLEDEMGAMLHGLDGHPQLRRSLISEWLRTSGGTLSHYDEEGIDELGSADRVLVYWSKSQLSAQVIAAAEGSSIARAGRGWPEIDYWMPNGSHLYVDMSGPELALGESSNALDQARLDRAGELTLGTAVERVEKYYNRYRSDNSVPLRMSLFKSNADFSDGTYGTHENYQTSVNLDYQRLQWHLVPLLVTRPVLVGGGGLVRNLEGELRPAVSYRSQHIDRTLGAQSTQDRPIILTRDEPHADRGRWRRLQILSGDANMNESATFLKSAMVHLTLRQIEEGATDFSKCTLLRPVDALRVLGRDTNLRQTVRLADGRKARPIEILGAYLEGAERFAQGASLTDADHLALRLWRELYDDMCRDPDSTSDRVDWVMKKKLFTAKAEVVGGFENPQVRQLDLFYNDLGPLGIYRLLRRKGHVRTLIGDEEALRWRSTPPSDTRAYTRTAVISWGKEMGNEISAVCWSGVHLVVDHNDTPHYARWELVDPLKSELDHDDLTIIGPVPDRTT